MDFAFTEEQKNIESICRNFAQQEIAPHIQLLENDLPFRLALFQKMAACSEI